MLSRIIKITLLMIVFILSAGISTYLTIHLLIQGKDTVVVPDLEGKEIVYALEILSDLRLNTKVKGSEFSAAVPKHHVISQDPVPGTEIKKGRDIRLVISKGLRTVLFPNLTGIAMPQARILLDENGLQQRALSNTYHPHVPKDEIIAQYPPAGFSGFRDDGIDLLVSAGSRPELFPMANLKGAGLNQAIIALEQFHLTVEAIHYIDDSKWPEDTVISHQPEAGYPVGPATGIEITINRKVNRPRAGHRSNEDLFRYRVPVGLLRQSVRVHIKRPAAGMDIFDAYVRPGQEIWLLIPETASATLLLYIDDELVKTKHYDRQE